MRITKEMVMAFKPCYTEEKIDGLLAGRQWVSLKTVAGLDIILDDKIWLLTKLMTEEQQREFSRRCALDVIHLWDAPDVVREYLETGNEELRSAAGDAARYGAGAAARAAVWAAARYAAVDAAWTAARDAAWAAAWAGAWSVAWAVAAARAATRCAAGDAAGAAAVAAAGDKYLDWCVEYLG